MISIKKILNEGLNEGLNDVYTQIKKHPGIQAKQLEALIKGKSLKTIESYISSLKSKGLIERRGSRKTGGYYVQ